MLRFVRRESNELKFRRTQPPTRFVLSLSKRLSSAFAAYVAQRNRAATALDSRLHLRSYLLV